MNELVEALQAMKATVDARLARMRAIVRGFILLPAILLMVTSAAPAEPAQPSRSDILSAVNETGATMATLNDWRAILLVAMVLASLMLIGLLAVVGMSFRTIGGMSTALGAVTTAMGSVRDTIQSNTLTLSRIESRLHVVSVPKDEHARL